MAIRFLLCLGAVWAAALCWDLSDALAQTELSSAQGRTAQFVFIIDDSGSMRVRTSDGPAADPERLAVFGTRSLLSMLDDRDEVSIVRLNGPADGEALTPIAALADNRKALERMLELDGVIAKYPGKHTPCDSALEAVKTQLNNAYRPNVMQVVIFLTDGECTGREPSAASFLRGLRAHNDGLFQFYLLRWRGRVYSRSLVTLATETGGTSAEVGADDPTEILQPFASMLSRSQGYETYLLTPSKRVLEAHKGARRMRLLAVAPDKGQDLQFVINPTVKGDTPTLLGAARTGVHQYQDGKRFRYAALDYRPGSTPVTIAVTGAGNDWKVVALPEYRLFVNMQISEGRCGQSGQDTNFVEVGAGVCATIDLVNEDGQPVTADVAGRGTEARVRYISSKNTKPADLPANRQGDAPRFVFERVNMEEGDHIFMPLITLSSAGTGPGASIRGASRNLQVSSRRISPDPARFEFGDLLPGTEQYHELTLRGNFPANRGRLVVESRKDLPECVTFELSGVPEGQTQEISPNQTYTVAVRVAAYCGPAAFKRELDTALRIEFDRGAHSAPTPAVVIPFRATLLNQIGIPESIATTVKAGDIRDLNVRLGGNQQRDIGFQAIFPATDERSNWPGDKLELVFLDDRAKIVRDDRNRFSLTHDVVFEAGKSTAKQAPPLRLRVISNPCCNGGVYKTELALVPTSGSRTPIRVPVEITVEEATLWSCWGPTIVRSILAILGLLLLLYLFNMYRNSSFLNRDRLVDRIVPLQWDEYGEPKVNTRATDDVRRMLRRNLTVTRRARAWLKANPLAFGLPGRAYNECCELNLSTSRNVDRSGLRHIEEADFFETVSKNPRQALAKIYVSARGGMSFFTAPAEGERVGSFTMQTDDYAAIDDEDFKAKIVTLRRRTEFLAMHTDREPDTMAGWRIG
ncbi:MAG: VWA domain-containing protein [Bradymonadaceae bacterium]|nr:VWA domain-containing protein [Lujinxingiaceae bacterium]